MILLFEHLCSNLNDAIVLEDSLVENSKLAVGSEKINQLLLQALLPILLGAKAKIFLPVHRLSNEYGWINLDILIIMIQYKNYEQYSIYEILLHSIPHSCVPSWSNAKTRARHDWHFVSNSEKAMCPSAKYWAHIGSHKPRLYHYQLAL